MLKHLAKLRIIKKYHLLQLDPNTSKTLDGTRHDQNSETRARKTQNCPLSSQNPNLTTQEASKEGVPISNRAMCEKVTTRRKFKIVIASTFEITRCIHWPPPLVSQCWFPPSHFEASTLMLIYSDVVLMSSSCLWSVLGWVLHLICLLGWPDLSLMMWSLPLLSPWWRLILTWCCLILSLQMFHLSSSCSMLIISGLKPEKEQNFESKSQKWTIFHKNHAS